MAALGINPLSYLRTVNPIEMMALEALAERTARHLNQRDTNLARMIAQETVKLLSKSFRGK